MSVGSGPSSSRSPAPLYCNAPEGHLRTLAMTESAEASSGRIHGRDGHVEDGGQAPYAFSSVKASGAVESHSDTAARIWLPARPGFRRGISLRLAHGRLS